MPIGILLIENNDASRRNIAAYLESFGYSVTDTGDGEEAIKLIQDIKYDVVITDLQLECMVNGIDILTRHRKASPEARSILMTGFGSEDAKAQAASLNAIYLEKPIQLGTLINLLDTAPSSM
jgi:CheY-like chemotaxis protein